MQIFHISISWWFFIGVKVIASLHRPPGLFSVFWPSLTMLSSGCSRLVLRFPTILAFIPRFWGLLQAPQLWLVSLHLQGPNMCLSFSFLWFSLCGPLGRASSLFLCDVLANVQHRDILVCEFELKSCYYVHYHYVWYPGRDYVIRLCFKILQNFMCLILQDRFWFVYIPFFHMFKFQFLAQFPVMHCLILHLQ